MGVVIVGRALVFPAVFAFQAIRRHQLGHPPTRAGLALLAQLCVDYVYAVPTFADDMNLLNLSSQGSVVDSTRADRPSLPSEGAAFGDVQHAAAGRRA